MRRITLRHELGAMGAVLLALAAPALAQRTASVRVIEAKQESIEEHRRVTGELRAIARARVASVEFGRVVEMPVREGDVVKAGDVLAKLDGRRLALERQRIIAREKVAQAILDARKGEQALEERNRDTLIRLAERNASQPKQVADAESQVAIAQARTEQAKQDLDVLVAEHDLLDVRIEDTTIVAPFDGVIIARSTEVGEWIGEGDPVVDLVGTGRYDAWIDVPQRYAATVFASRRPMSLVIDATSERLDDLVPHIIPVVDEAARSFLVRLAVDDRDGHLVHGMSVTAWVPTGVKGDFLTVPRDALLRNDAGYFVYVAQPSADGHVATPAPVTVLFEVDSRAVVRGAVQPGDLVVVEGNERLFPMTPVAPFQGDGDGDRN